MAAEEVFVEGIGRLVHRVDQKPKAIVQRRPGRSAVILTLSVVISPSTGSLPP